MNNRRYTEQTASTPYPRKKIFQRSGSNASDKFESRGRIEPRGNTDTSPRFDPDRKYNPDRKFDPKRKFQPAKKKLFKPRVIERDKGPKSETQIIFGKHEGKALEVSVSPKAKFTARRVRETLFHVLYRRTRFSRFLDLCSGSGSVGLEAISRGALLSTFVERSARLCSKVKKNMASFGIKEGHGEVVELEVVPFLKKMKKRHRVWDIAFFDPPFDANYDEVLEMFSKGTALKKKRGILVVAHHPEMFFPEKMGVLRRFRVVNVPDTETALSFYENKR